MTAALLHRAASAAFADPDPRWQPIAAWLAHAARAWPVVWATLTEPDGPDPTPEATIASIYRDQLATARALVGEEGTTDE